MLLKNANNTLPLNVATLKSIAVIGPRANDNPIDMYAGVPPYSITPVEGVRRKLRPQTILHHVDDNNMDLMIQAAKEAEVAGSRRRQSSHLWRQARHRPVQPDTSTKPCADRTEGREGRDRESIDLSQEDLIRKVYAVNPRTIVVLVSSFPYAIPWTQANIPAILQSAHSSQDEGTAIADVLFGDYNPGGKLNQTWAQVARAASAHGRLRHPPWPHLHVLQRRSALSLRIRPQLHHVPVLQFEVVRRVALVGRHSHHLRRC